MRRLLPYLLLAMVLVGCGPTAKPPRDPSVGPNLIPVDPAIGVWSGTLGGQGAVLSIRSNGTYQIQTNKLVRGSWKGNGKEIELSPDRASGGKPVTATVEGPKELVLHGSPPATFSKP